MADGHRELGGVALGSSVADATCPCWNFRAVHNKKKQRKRRGLLSAIQAGTAGFRSYCPPRVRRTRYRTYAHSAATFCCLVDNQQQ